MLARNTRSATQERKDERMGAQEHVALAQSLADLFNNRQSDPAWLDKSVAAFAADCEVVNAASGTTFHGQEGYKRFIRFFVENFPDSRSELRNVLVTEDQVVREGTWHRNNTDPLYLPSGALPATGHAGGVQFCQVLQIRNGKIASLRCYYDMTTLLEYFGLAPATAKAT
jgi:ketosteroid isomerase-like protein